MRTAIHPESRVPGVLSLGRVAEVMGSYCVNLGGLVVSKFV